MTVRVMPVLERNLQHKPLSTHRTRITPPDQSRINKILTLYVDWEMLNHKYIFNWKYEINNQGVTPAQHYLLVYLFWLHSHLGSVIMDMRGLYFVGDVSPHHQGYVTSMITRSVWSFLFSTSFQWYLARNTPVSSCSCRKPLETLPNVFSSGRNL